MNNYPPNLINNLQKKMKNVLKMPVRKRKPVELRLSETKSMKRKHPEFGYHKNYVHPWSIFQKGCALQYRQLTTKQKKQLQLRLPNKSPLRLPNKSPLRLTNKNPLILSPLILTNKSPLKLTNKNPLILSPLRLKNKSPVGPVLKSKTINRWSPSKITASSKPTENPSKYKKGHQQNGYEITMQKSGAGSKRVWKKIKSI